MSQRHGKAKPAGRAKSAQQTPRRRLRPGLLAGAAVVIGAVGVAWLAWTTGGGDGFGSAGVAGASRFNVLLITLDTTRADRLGCYGYAAARTPTIDALAASGVRFEQAFCHAPLTLPSHASILTGLCPPATGVRINGGAALGRGVPTLAEAFKRHGYRTGAFIGAAVLDSAFGLGRGFDLYDDDIYADAGADDAGTDRRANRVCDSALDWLGDGSEKAFFAWVHFFDPHTPYDPPPGFEPPSGDRYDGEIAFVDSQVHRLLDWLEQAGEREKTMIVVVGDHGESFEEHGESEHGFFVYDTTMRVPAIVSFPARLSTPQTVSQPARLVDLFPTIVDLLGWDVPADLHGRSLARACRTGHAPVLPVYGETEYPRLAFGWASLRSLADDRWKYIDAPDPELYDRQDDPRELKNLIKDQPDVAARMRRDLLELVADMKSSAYAAQQMELSGDLVERLATLGYVAGTSGTGELDEGVQRRDPKEMLAVYRTFTRALGMVAGGNYLQAAGVLEPLVRLSPESGEIHNLLATAYLKLDRFAEAQRGFEESLRTITPNRRRLFGLAEALRNQNKLGDAIPIYEQALAMSPDWELAHQGLATVYSQMKRYPEAEEHWRRCVEIDPTSAYYLTNLGTTLFAQRKPAEAIPFLQNALKHDPANEYAHRSLWQSLMAVGRRADAIRTLQDALEVMPHAKSLTCPLAWLLATTPRTASSDIEKAIRWAQECCETAPGNARNFDTLAAAYAAGGDFERAVEAAREAVELATRRGRIPLRRQIEARLRLYESGKPFVQAPPRLP